MTSLLEVKGLTKRFGGLIACQDVNLEIGEGQVVGLIGPNGAGKTTIFNCISGFYKPTAGTIKFAGQEITKLPSYRVPHTGLVRTFQVVKVLMDMSVVENVMVGVFGKTSRVNEARRRAEEILSLTRLESKALLPARSLTIADKKRLEVAMTLGLQPKLLMLDETMAGLNSSEIHEALDLLRNLQKEQRITLFMVEHVLEALIPIAEWIYVLDGGRLIAQGVPETVLNDPAVIEAYLGVKYHAKGR
ncbi:MAG: ABC transporter ATP-binding protein [Desulfobaccales bacterium]